MSDLTGQPLGQYEILSRIGRGSVSTVYKAYQPKLERYVAIKVLSPHVVDEEGFLERFTQEARAVAQLDHPNIVPVYDFDQVGDIAYIVMRYVESGTLRSMMMHGPLDLDLMVDIATQVGLALGYAHRHDVVHRDVKPSNILVGEGHWALLTDFGLAKILGGVRQLTPSGVGMGTPDYMAPEQAQGLGGDGRADLYSFGVMLYEMVTGRLPFEADSAMAVVVKHITEQPPPPRVFNPDLPQAIEQVILTAMDKDPQMRFQTAEKMVTALVCAAGRQERATLPVVDVAAWGIHRSAKLTPAPTPGRAVGVKRLRGQAKNLNWTRLFRRVGMALGAVLALIAVMAVWGRLAWGRPADLGASPTMTAAQPTAAAATTASTPVSIATAAPKPGVGLVDTPVPTSMATPALTYLSPRAKIRPGIYVKAIKPDGVVLRKAAGFEADYMTTLPKDTVLYVLQGPARSGNLWWVKLNSGAWVGWAVQDEVTAFAVKPTP